MSDTKLIKLVNIWFGYYQNLSESNYKMLKEILTSTQTTKDIKQISKALKKASRGKK